MLALTCELLVLAFGLQQKQNKNMKHKSTHGCMDQGRCVALGYDDLDYSVASKWTWKTKLERSVVLSTCSIFRTRASVSDMSLRIDRVGFAIGRYCCPSLMHSVATLTDARGS